MARWAEGKNKGFSRIGRGMGTHLGNEGGRDSVWVKVAGVEAVGVGQSVRMWKETQVSRGASLAGVERELCRVKFQTATLPVTWEDWSFHPYKLLNKLRPTSLVHTTRIHIDT